MRPRTLSRKVDLAATLKGSMLQIPNSKIPGLEHHCFGAGALRVAGLLVVAAAGVGVALVVAPTAVGGVSGKVVSAVKTPAATVFSASGRATKILPVISPSETGP